MWLKVGSVDAEPLINIPESGHIMVEIEMPDDAGAQTQATAVSNDDWRNQAIRKQMKKQFLVAKLNGEFTVTSNACPHALLPLDEGELKNSCITCPFHGYTYHLKSGVNIDMPDEPNLPIYPSRVEAGVLEVNLD